MPEILYRNAEHRFSVYRLRDIPDGVRRSGWIGVGEAARHFAERALQIDVGHYDRENMAAFTEIRSMMFEATTVCCAVLDEHAGSLAQPTFTVTPVRYRVEVPTIDIHRETTRHLGAQHGEHQISRVIRNASPMAVARDSAAWSAHLRYLVAQSEQRDREQAPSVGWDPYGDDL